MNNVILIRFNEIHLKGGNKKYFIKLLHNNIKIALKDFDCKIENIQNRLVVRDYDDEDGIIENLKCVFGIHSISKAVEMDNDVNLIEDFISNIHLDCKTFKCEVNRADKSFPIKSNDFAARLGELILKNNDV
ncbi:MAG TPA: tRNA 4-thiouridine(8) synthase ThiI, partial [Candidatus Onthoplasma faecigallinarum]|nr:tRNA 4-thiouridine(8) synthase ThiI [Candidatus Onthoplasma faecigallinarum]